MQEVDLGGLRPQRQRQLRQVAQQLKQTGAANTRPRPELKPGTRLAREWQGRTYDVLVHAPPLAVGPGEKDHRHGVVGVALLRIETEPHRCSQALAGTTFSRRGRRCRELTRAASVRGLVDKVVVDEKTIIIELRRGALLGGDAPSSASEDGRDDAVELTATTAFRRRGAEIKLVLPGFAQQKHSPTCDPALIKAIARGRAWFEELAIGRARSLQELARRDGITRRYIRRLVGLTFLSPELVELILQGRQPVGLTATRLTELDLPLDWTEQHKLLAS